MTNTDPIPQSAPRSICPNWRAGLAATFSTLIFPLICGLLFLALLVFDPQANTTQITSQIVQKLQSGLNFGIFFPVLIAAILAYFIRKKLGTLNNLMQELAIIASSAAGILIALTITLALLDGSNRVACVESVVYQGLIILAVMTLSTAFALNCCLAGKKTLSHSTPHA